MFFSFFEKISGIRKGEGFALIFFILQGILLQSGIALGISASDALFLNRNGSESLPLLYIIMPVVMVLFIPLLSFSMYRFHIRKFMEGIHILIAVLSLGAYFLSLKEAGWVFYALKLNAYLWMVSLYSIFWNQVDHYYTAIEARRLYPLLSAALSAGAMIGGFLASHFAEHNGVSYLYLLWSGVAIAGFFMQVLFAGRLRLVFFRENEGETRVRTGQILKYASTSPYGAMLSVSMVFLILMTTFAEYFYLDIFSENIQNADSLAAYIGSLFFIANFINLFINLFVYRLLLRFSGFLFLVPLQSLLYMGAFLWMYLDYGMNSAIFAFLIYQAIQLSIDLNNWN
ncbi:MAG: hypothetical protein OEZ34_17340, partial [Spirochaetia bacterium]|nr:hypothetical protein [Spirochaetia bacterium]